MLSRKDETGTKEAQGAGERPSNDAAYMAAATAAAAAAAAAAAITGAADLHVTAVSESVSRFDEAARKRVNRMNEKLKELEAQMEVLEAEMSKAKDFFECA